MTIQQMLLGASLPPLEGSTTHILGEIINVYPAPGTHLVTATGTSGATGGTGTYSISWSIISGGASISGPSNSDSVTVAQTLVDGQTSTGIIRCTINDGVSQISIDRNYTLRYEIIGI